METKRATNRTNTNNAHFRKNKEKHIVPRQNVSSQSTVAFLKTLLDEKHVCKEILYSIGIQLAGNNTNPAYLHFLRSCNLQDIGVQVPEDVAEEHDLLGTAYQFLNAKGDNLKQGTFYTGASLAKSLASDIHVDNLTTVFDPSCGSGNLLLVSGAAPENLYGIDNDPIAIMVAKFNF